jgi:hypothetical protein
LLSQKRFSQLNLEKSTGFPTFGIKSEKISLRTETFPKKSVLNLLIKSSFKETKKSTLSIKSKPSLIMNPNQPRRDDPYLQRDSLDRGGAGDFRQFVGGQGPAVSGGHVTVDAIQRPITQEERIGSVVSGSALSGATMGGIAGMGSGVSTTPVATTTALPVQKQQLQQQQGVMDPKWDVPGATLGDRLKNAVVQTIHESQVLLRL